MSKLAGAAQLKERPPPVKDPTFADLYSHKGSKFTFFMIQNLGTFSSSPMNIFKNRRAYGHTQKFQPEI